MINKLDNLDEAVAHQIFTVFQSAYKVEAHLIEASQFPPLLRTREDIQESATLFYGVYESGCLAGVIEIAKKGKTLEIDSLTIEPSHFRKGIAGILIRYVLDSFEYAQAIVETAVANGPAISLYKKYGFVEFKRWTPSHGIPKLAMSVKKRPVC
ncbi:MAG: GNAT family N-acetyltransferase [Alteromonadaceae bacterium]|nr:GNAT family N-acetyltransferase [Alteromonadaceae bacterium]